MHTHPSFLRIFACNFMRCLLVWAGPRATVCPCASLSSFTCCNTVGTVARRRQECLYCSHSSPVSLMPSEDNLTVSKKTPDADRDHRAGQNLSGDRFISWRTQGTTHQHPQLRSLIAKHCEQLSSELVDAFRTEVEREVKQRVSEVIVSEATVFCEQLRSKDDALLAEENRCKDLREQLELSNKICGQLQERVKQLETTEAELRVALNERLEDVRLSPSPRLFFSIQWLSLQQQAGVTPPPLETRHLTVVYERRESRMLCRLCV